MSPPSTFAGKFVSRGQFGIGLVEERFLPRELSLTTAYLHKAGQDVEAQDLAGGDLDFSPYQVAVVWGSLLHTFHHDIDWLHRAKEGGNSYPWYSGRTSSGASEKAMSPRAPAELLNVSQHNPAPKSFTEVMEADGSSSRRLLGHG